MAWNNKPKSGLPALPGMKKLPKPYSDENLNSTVPLKLQAPGVQSSMALPNPNAAEQELSPKAARFRRLAGILGPKK